MPDLASQLFFANQSLAASFTSAVFDKLIYAGVAFSVSWSAGAIGTLIVQGSTDNLNFSDFDMETLVLNNAADSGVFDISTNLQFLRLSYTRSSSTGTMTCYISARGH